MLLDTIERDGTPKSPSPTEFYKLTPLHPADRLRLRPAHILTTRVIDLVIADRKGQAALIVSLRMRVDDGAAGGLANCHRDQPRVATYCGCVDERP